MRLRRLLSDFVVGQANPEARLRAVRTTVGLIGAVSMAALPPAEFVRTHRRDLADMGHTDSTLPPSAYPWLKVAGLTTSLAAAARGSTTTTLLAALTSGAASRESAATYRRLWTYDTHATALLLLAATPLPADGPERRQRASLILALMQSLVGCVYGQAALAKIRNDRDGWLRTGDTLRGSVAIMGTSVGRRLLDRPGLFPILSTSSLLLEAAMPIATLSGPRGQRWAGMAALAFHTTTAVTLKIPFWHLAAALPPLFIYRNGTDDAAGRCATRPAQRKRAR